MNLSVVILAAGLGKRMKTRKPKVLHEVLGIPMLQHVIDAVRPLKPDEVVVVVGNGAEEVKVRIAGKGIFYVTQKSLLGTGNALTIARKALKKRGNILVLNGDCPLITTKTLRGFLTKHRRSRNSLSYLSFIDESLKGYGRTIRDSSGMVTGIVEDRHASRQEKKAFKELNGGVYALNQEALSFMGRIKKNADSGEYYLTDLINILSRAGKKVNTYICSQEEILGVNSREDLYKVSSIFQSRVITALLNKGVTFIDPDRSVVHPLVKIGSDSVIYPNTYLEGETSLGSNCVIYPGSRIVDSSLGNEVVVKDNTLIEESRIAKGALIGPLAHLRPQSIIGKNAKVGNFVEIKKSTIGDGTKASHLSYLGDAEVGNDVNIGAGTITCNYDGKKKHRTVIGPGVFIGSDTQLIAPVMIGKGAYVGAGATITKDVPAGALAISRTEQKNLANWKKRKGKNKK
jgi:bifunctional UDP-N-acetylglucosamine pyrophosphorylase/glucosamine-1-phosphate N-acetyltransferase